MFSLYNKIYSIKKPKLRNFLISTYCLIIVLVISTIIAIPLLFLLYFVANYIVVPLLFFVCCFIPWLIEGGKQ